MDRVCPSGYPSATEMLLGVPLWVGLGAFSSHGDPESFSFPRWVSPPCPSWLAFMG